MMNVKIGYCVFDYKRGWIKQTSNTCLEFTMQFNLAKIYDDLNEARNDKQHIVNKCDIQMLKSQWIKVGICE